MGQPPANKSLAQWTALVYVHGHCTASMIRIAQLPDPGANDHSFYSKYFYNVIQSEVV
jgi:hypothetical protein